MGGPYRLVHTRYKSTYYYARQVQIPNCADWVCLDHSCNKYCDLIGPHRYSKSHRILVNSQRVLVNPHRVPVNLPQA